MASVYQRKGSAFWMARFKDARDQWQARSTKTTNRAEAVKIAFGWESAGARIALDNPRGAQIEKVIRDLLELHTGERMEPNPAAEWLTRWVATRKAQKAVKTAERYAKVIADFIKHLGDRANLDLRTVQGQDVQAFADAESKAGKGPTTVRLNAKILRAAFNDAVRSAAIERNPAGAIVLPDAMAEEREAFTSNEVQAILRKAKGTNWETAVLLGAFCGMRLGDATNLTWASVDLSKGLITYTPEKTKRKKRALVCPMAKPLRDHLDRLASTDKAQRSQHLCPKLAGRPVGGRAGLSAEFIALVDAAGIEQKQGEAKQGYGRRLNLKSFHSLRHSFVSELANKGVAADVRRKLAGHASERMTERYTHLEAATLRKAVAKLPTH